MLKEPMKSSAKNIKSKWRLFEFIMKTEYAVLLCSIDNAVPLLKTFVA